MKNLPYDRSERAALQIRDLVMELCAFQLNDPRLTNIQITGVVLTKDFQIARIYFYTTGGRKEVETYLNGLKSAQGTIKREIAIRLNMKYTPTLEFFFDESVEKGKKIEDLLESLNSENG